MTDYTLADTIHIMFTTRQFSTGAPFTLAGTPVVSAYEDASTTQITAGITLGVDHDGVTGLNLLTIVASGANGYESGKDYNLVITTGTVDSVSVVGEVVGRFTLGRSTISTAGAAVIADSVWDEDIVAAHGTADTAGRALRTLDAISDRTNNNNLNALLGVPDTASADVPTVTATEVTTAMHTDNTGLGAGDVVAGSPIANIFSYFGLTTRAEPGQGAPAATLSPFAKLDYLYKSWRNRKTQTATTWRLYADDATTVDQKSTISDNGTTAERGEVETGP